MFSKSHLMRLLPIVPALMIYAWLANDLNFIQDDAYISYRYVANFLNGHGLVYNIGERVEGFTNFGWTIYMILLGAIGLSYIFFSQLTGALFGGGLIVLTYLIAEQIIGEKNRLFVYLPVYLVGATISLAYWAPAGLETAAFAFFALWSFYLYLKRSWLLVFTLVMAVWMRPEGAVVTGLLIIIDAIEYRRLPRFVLACAGMALVFSLPFVIFKIVYYGSIFPNPFYAKTGLNLEYISSGFEYLSRFFTHYSVLAGGLALALLFLLFGKLSSNSRCLFYFVILYLAYIVLIGGDVLKAHRFFLPLFGPLAVIAALALFKLLERLVPRTRMLVLIVVGAAMLVTTYLQPKKFVYDYNYLEKKFTTKMAKLADRLQESDQSDFSVALATIGIFGYRLLGHDIIDMVGLTDSTVARHNDPPIEGMSTTWKERNHNSSYLLERGPDYIMFSTGIKPSAPAERALFLYRQFTDVYRTIGWYFKIYDSDRNGQVFNVFKRTHPVEGEIVPYYPISYVQEYKDGLDSYSRSDFKTALAHFDRSLQLSPKPYNIYVVYQKAFSHTMLGQDNIARPLLDAVVARDSTVFEAHRDLYLFARMHGDQTAAEIHKRWLIKLVPWYWPQVEAYVNQQVAKVRRGSGR